MSGDNDKNGSVSGGGRSMSGGANEPMPSTWNRPSQAPRIGRIGDWASQRYVLASFQRSTDPTRSSSGGDQPAGLGGSSRGGQMPISDDDEDDKENEGENWFAGGERRYVQLDQGALKGWC